MQLYLNKFSIEFELQRKIIRKMERRARREVGSLVLYGPGISLVLTSTPAWLKRVQEELVGMYKDLLTSKSYCGFEVMFSGKCGAVEYCYIYTISHHTYLQNILHSREHHKRNAGSYIAESRSVSMAIVATVYQQWTHCYQTNTYQLW